MLKSVLAQKIPLKGLWLALRQTPLVDAWIHQRGPIASRVPQVLRERAVFQAQISALPGAKIWRFAPLEEVRPQQPGPESGPSISLLPLALRARRLPPPFAAQLEEAWLVGRHATPFTREGRMLLTPFLDRLTMLGADEHDDLARWAQSSGWSQAPSAEQSQWSEETVCSLVGRLDSNFFHWLIDICGQLEALQIYRERTGAEPKILIRAASPPFVRQSLELLGFDASRLLEWPLEWAAGHKAGEVPHQVVARRVGRLVVPSWRGYSMGPSPRSLRWLRHAFLQAVGEDTQQNDQPGAPSRKASHKANRDEGPKIYIHRERGGWRCVENGEEVCAFMEARGFEILRPETKSLAEQVRLFARASAIVGMHGAGLTNILFAPRAHFVEIIGSYGGADYLFMTQALGNRYSRVTCPDHGDNIVVDLKRLGDAIESVA